jgi:formiminotetrahydrofolate cyclodeaminase
MFKEMTVQEFIEKLASDAPTPGGGTAAAIMGAMGAGLFKMTIDITAKKVDDDLLKSIGESMQGAYEEFLTLADKDAEAFDEYMKAKSMPKGTEEEKAARKEALKVARIKSIEAPMQTLERSLEVLQAFDMIKDKISKYVLSDVVGGASALKSAAKIAYANVKINVGGKGAYAHYMENANKLMADASKLANEIIDFAMERM